MHTLLCDKRVYTLVAITVEPPGFAMIGAAIPNVVETQLPWSNITPPGGLIVQAVSLGKSDLAIELVVDSVAGRASVFIHPAMGPVLILCRRRVNNYFALLNTNDRISAMQVTDVEYVKNL